MGFFFEYFVCKVRLKCAIADRVTESDAAFPFNDQCCFTHSVPRTALA